MALSVPITTAIIYKSDVSIFKEVQPGIQLYHTTWMARDSRTHCVRREEGGGGREEMGEGGCPGEISILSHAAFLSLLQELLNAGFRTRIEILCKSDHSGCQDLVRSW